MKRLIIIVLWSFIILNINAQKNGLNSRTNDNIIVVDHTGSQENCLIDLQIIAGEVKEHFTDSLKIILYKTYTPIVYINEVAGINVMEQKIKQYAQNLSGNYIIFQIIVHKENNNPNVKVFYNINDNAFTSTLCSGKKELLFSNIEKKLEEKKVNHLNDIDCTIKEALQDMESYLNSDCDFNLEERRNWWLNNDFESVPLAGVDLIIQDSLLDNNKIKETNRSSTICHTIDYTLGTLKLSTGINDVVAVNTLISQITGDFDDYRIVISDFRLSDANAIDFHQVEINSLTCRGLIWVHFPGTFINGEDEVLIKIKRNNDPTYNEYNYTLEELQEKYDLNTDFFDDFIKIDFRLHDHKDEIIQFISNLGTDNPYVDLVFLSSFEYYAGFISGFGDGMIETLDLISLVAQASEKFNTEFNPSSVNWWKDLFFHYREKNNLFEAIRTKWGDTYDSWISLANYSGKLINYLSNDYLRGEFAMAFKEAIVGGMIDWGKDLIFINGPYESGYVQGKLLFDLIPVGAFFKAVTKGSMFAIKNSKNIAVEIGKNIGDQIDGPTRRAILKESKGVVDLGDLAKKLINRPNLKHWYDNGMPKEVKTELSKYIDNDDFLSQLDNDLGNSKWKNDIKELIISKPTDLTDKYKLLKDDAGKAWEVAAEDPTWGDWAQRTFFKDVVAKAKLFEDGASLQSFLNTHGLIENQIVKQVTLEVNGIKVRFDFIGKDNTGKFYFGEAKFSTKNKNWHADWLDASTANQKIVFPLFENNGVTSIVVKATDQLKIQQLFDRLGLNPDDVIELADIESFKIFGSGAGTQVVSQTVSLYP